MRRLVFVFLYLIIMITIGATSAFGISQKARIAIVTTSAGVEHNWSLTQRTGHAWAAVANMAGIPYDTLYLDDLLKADFSTAADQYQAVILAQCRYVSDAQFSGLSGFISAYLARRGNLIIEGPLAFFDENEQVRAENEIFAKLNIINMGWREVEHHRIQTVDSLHSILREFHPGEFITQHLYGGLNILHFKNNQDQLLSANGSENSFPFLSARTLDKGRVLLLSDVFADGGVTSFFRNVQPSLFYKNRMYDCLVAALYWTVYGEQQSPFPAIQLSAARLAAIGRLDGDLTWNLDAVNATFKYLTDMARESGVVSVYGLVSSEQDKEGWDVLSQLAARFERFGGQIGTHSHYHEMDVELTEEIAHDELDASIKTIESEMEKRNLPIGKVDFFINPNNTIPLEYYETIAKRFSFFMTHGWEQSTPLGYGNLTWNTGDNRDFVVIDNSPAPDYQWFYAPEWSYSTEQITAYEEAIFDHMFHGVGRGVIFNQMWHDYSIVSTPLDEVYDEGFNLLDWFRGKERRIANENHLPMYDALAAKFASYAIYCPDPYDLANKLRAMAKMSYTWQTENKAIDMDIDLSDLTSATIAQFTGGMGIRIENCADRIQSVMINGQPHPAFNENIVILPNLKAGKNLIRIQTGQSFVNKSRLTYISKRMPAIRQTNNQIKTTVLTKSKAKFSYYIEKPFILLNADRQEWNRKGDRILHGYVTSDRELILKELSKDDLIVTRSTVVIRDYQKKENTIAITVANSQDTEKSIWFKSPRPPTKVTFEGKDLDFKNMGSYYRIALPDFIESPQIIINL